MLFICLGIAATSFAAVDIQEEGPDIKNLIMLVAGIAVIAFGIYCVTQAAVYYHEKENPKREIITSTPPQVDTVITIINSTPDTTYIYKFDNTKDSI